MTDEEKNIFGKQLRERRNELNLTTQKVALDAEVGESTYKRLEAGDGNPRLDTLVKIVKCLKTDLNSVVPQEHLCKDAGIWQIVRKLLSMDKKKMNKAIKAILAMLDAEGIITKEKYMLKKMQITDRMNGIQAEIETLTRLSAEEEAYKSKVASAVELLEGEMQHEKITKELINATIDTVYVYDKKRIEVVFSFDDVLMKAIEKYQKGVKEA